MRSLRVSLLSSSISLVCIAPAIAQQPTAPPAKTPTPQASGAPGAAKKRGAENPAATKPTDAQVRKLLELLRVRDDLQATLDSMRLHMQREAEQVFRDKFPNPSPQQLQSVKSIVDDSFQEVSLDDLIQDLVPVYQRHLTRSDVQALVAFYSSAPGQKILREQPAMIKESMQATGSNQQKRMEAVLARMELRMQQFVEQEQNKAGRK